MSSLQPWLTRYNHQVLSGTFQAKNIFSPFSYNVFKAVQVRPVSRKGIMLCVRPAGGGQRRDEDRLQRDQDLAEGGLLHHTFQQLEVDTHAESGAVTIHLKDTFTQT